MSEGPDDPPAVSVVVPTRDRAEVLPRALESVLGQTFSQLELIVVDDDSTDRTPEVLAALEDERLRVERLPAPGGANAARNRGVELARGAYVSFLDSDDELHARYLERVMEVFLEHGDRCEGVFTAFELARDGRRVGRSRAPEGVLSREAILADNVVGSFSCTTFRASIFSRVGPLDEELRSQQDYDFLLRAVRAGCELRGLDEPLVTCHLDGDRVSGDLERGLQGTRRIVEKHGDDLRPEGIARLHYYRAFSYGRAGRMRDARRELRATLRKDPTRWLAYLHLPATAHPWLFRTLLWLKEWVRSRLITSRRRRP